MGEQKLQDKRAEIKPRSAESAFWAETCLQTARNCYRILLILVVCWQPGLNQRKN